MELAQLKYFKTIAEHGTMSRAAGVLHVSQPALSASMKKLEDELGVNLFDRGKNSVVLNENGRAVLAYAEKILTLADEMRDGFRQNAVLKLGFCDPGAMRFAVPLFQKAHPDAAVTSELIFDEREIENLLLSRRYDAVVSLRRPENAAIETVPFVDEELMLSVDANDPLARRDGVCLANEPPLKMAVYCGRGAFLDQTKAFLDTLKNRHDIRMFDDYFVFRQLLDGEKRATLTTKLVRQYRNDGAGRVIVPLTDDGVKADYILSYLVENKRKVKPLADWAASISTRR